MAKGPGRHYREGISLIELFKKFPDDKTAEAWFENERWSDWMYCPRCGGVDKVKPIISRKPMPFWCGDCQQRFSVRTGTLMERSHIPYQKWAIAIYLHISSLKGVSSMKLHRDLNITQKSAWFMMHRIREAYDSSASLLDGPVEVDETYIGGLEGNKHAHEKLHAGRGAIGKTAVAGIKDRKTREVRVEVVDDTTKDTLQGFVEDHVKPEAKKYTDENTAYSGMLNRSTCSHAVGEWVNGQAHINGLESFWSMLKRGYHGTFHRMSVKHLHRYVSEFAYRNNIRHMDTIDQMRNLVAGMVGKRLMYQDLIKD